MWPDDDLNFDEENHRYYNDDDVTLVSVTQLIKMYSLPFDAMAHSERIAQRDGVDAQQLRNKWELNSHVAADRGTHVHAEIEDICANIMHSRTIAINMNQCAEYESLMRAVAKFFAEHVELCNGWVMPEYRICHPDYGIAGTVDLLASNYKGLPAIIDWKTNKSMEVDGYQNMQPPFQRGKLALPDSNMYHYFLQLNLYRRILMERYSFEPQLMSIIHMEQNCFTEYEVPVMDAHVDRLLEGITCKPF
jgi:ATP-dependent exoDNAse (exonuclease V) beta subunit